jgi:hypothetical protein
MKEMKEKILCSAIWYDDGKAHVHQPKNIKAGYVICGMRHHNCIALHTLLTGKVTNASNVQGFITDKDRFVDRNEAGEIAFKAMQVPKRNNLLYSEDLY